MVCFVLGLIYFLIHQGSLVVLWNRFARASVVEFQKVKDRFTKKKKIKLYYWNGDRLSSGEVDLVWFADEIENINDKRLKKMNLFLKFS